MLHYHKIMRYLIIDFIHLSMSPIFSTTFCKSQQAFVQIQLLQTGH